MNTSITQLAEHAHRIRRNALLMGEVQGQGYIGQALDIADVLAVAYFGAMNYRPDDPEWEERDRFLLSNGHYAIALYAALFEAGILPQDELETYGSDDSRLPMSGMASYTPGMEMSGGSLGPRTHDCGRPLPRSQAQGLEVLRLHALLRWRTRRRFGLGRTDVRRALEARQPHRDGRREQSASRWPVDADHGVRAARREARSVRLVRAAHRRQRYRRREAGLRQRAQSEGREAAHHRVRYEDGLRRAVPRRAREESFHPRRSARVATRAAKHSKPGDNA